jgi:hypothetical protein
MLKIGLEKKRVQKTEAVNYAIGDLQFLGLVVLKCQL